jgi:hypothetical protein
MANKEMQDLKVVQEDWMVKKWRPMMGWTYMMTCIFDFILGPILYNLLQYYNPGQAVGMWVPLTLQGGGLYHLAMGAVLGITAWSRGQEKMAGAADPAPQPPVMMQQPEPVYQQPVYTPQVQAPVVQTPVAPVQTQINTTDTSGKPKRRKDPNF